MKWNRKTARIVIIAILSVALVAWVVLMITVFGRDKEPEKEKKNGLDLISSIRIAVQKIGTAITVSGLTTVFGFAALLLSTSPMIQNFGAITVVTVVFSLLGAIIVMPASLAVFENLKAHLDAKKQERLSKRGI